MKRLIACAAVVLLLFPLIAGALAQSTEGVVSEDELLVIGSRYRIHHPSVTADREYEIQAYSPRGWVKVGRPGDSESGAWLNLQHIAALFPVEARPVEN